MGGPFSPAQTALRLAEPPWDSDILLMAEHRAGITWSDGDGNAGWPVSSTFKHVAYSSFSNLYVNSS